MVMGESGIFNKAKVAKEQTSLTDAMETLQMMLLEIKTQVITEDKRDTLVTDCNKLEGKNNITKIEYINGDGESVGDEINNAEYVLITYLNYKFKVNEKLEIVSENNVDKDDIDIAKLKKMKFYEETSNPNKVITNYEHPGIRAYQAFDGIKTNRYNSRDIKTGEWPYIGYIYDKEVYMDKIELDNYSSDETAVKKFKVQSSEDGENWIDETKTLNAEFKSETQTYEINSKGKAKYWRIQIEENYGYEYHNCSISELTFYATEDRTEDYFVIPIMASNEKVSEEENKNLLGTVITNYEHPEIKAYQAFDGIRSNRYNSRDVRTEEWPYLGYIFPSKLSLKKIKLNNYSSDETGVKKFKVQSSSDGKNWRDETETLNAELKNEAQIYEVNSITKAQYWRIQIEENYGYEYHNCSISELQFYMK